MNKTKLILAGTGGVIGLAVLAMAYFTWGAFSAKTAALEGDQDEGTDGLETVLSKAQTLSRKSVYPCAASLAAIESNRTAIVEWQKEAKKLAVRGDRAYPKTTPAAFKEFLVMDAKRLAALPGAVKGVLVKPDFLFGPFKDYISGGKMPADADLAELQRRWDDVATVVETLAQCGIAELTDVSFAVAGDGTDREDGKDKREQDKKNKKAKPARKSAQTSKQATDQATQPVSFRYTVSFTAKPAAFVKVLNSFVVSERFITVEDFSFRHSKDTIAEALGAEEKQAVASTGRRRGRRAAAVEEKNEAEGEAKGGIITDPLLDAPFSVVLTVNVRDFRSLEETKAEEVQK